MLAVIYLLTSTSGLLLFKMGNNHTKTMISFQNGAAQFNISYLTLVGMLCYITSFVIFLIIVAKYNLTYVVPILSGCLYILIFLGAVFILKEKVSLLAVAGSAITLAGMLMITIAK
jgi:drug/metabolite transporter (DMT)-like permease